MIGFLDFLFPKSPPTGYVSDSRDWIASLPRHDLFAGGNADAPDWGSLAPPFRFQEGTMMCTAFAGCSIVSMLEARETGNRRTFSPLELYTRANGSSVGNTVQNTVNALAGGLVEEKDCPWISPVSDWDPFVLRLMGEYAKARSGDRLDPSVAVKSATYVTPTHDAIREALKDSPVLAIVPVGRGYFDDPAPYTASGSAHAVVITKVADDGKIHVFDSLTQGKDGYDGHHWLASDFPVLYAFGLLDLPDDWKQEVSVVNRYGKPRDVAAEMKADAALKAAKAKNPTHAAFLDRDWQFYVNVVAYSGFTVIDVLNEITCIRRGLKLPFDFTVAKI